MLRLSRLEVPGEAGNYLKTKTSQLEAAKADRRGILAKALWKTKSANQFRALRAVLAEMCSGHERCMYCEDSSGAHIDHWKPISIEPMSAFVWENYPLACSVCNSNFKRDEFPLDRDGVPELIDPTSEDPALHLTFSPTTGRYEPVPDSPKARESIRVFGLNRSALELARQDAWKLYEVGIVAYDQAVGQGKLAKAESISGLLRRAPFAGVLRSLLDCCDGPGADHLGPECRLSLTQRPEIRDWLD